MFLSTRTVKAIEYDSNLILAGKATQVSAKGSFRFGPLDLALAHAKTLHSRKPTIFESIFELGESFWRIQRTGASSFGAKSDNLRLIDGFRTLYRDFSLSARVGELAQAINYLFIQEVLRYPVVTDFREFLSQTAIPLPSKKSKAPDFIGSCSQGKCGYILLESKGFGAHKETAPVKEQLLNGLIQCQTGSAWLTKNSIPQPEATYASLVQFAELGDNWDSTIHWCDPSGDERQLDESSIRHLVRMSYAAYVAAIGRLDIANQILHPDQRQARALERIEFEEDFYYILQSVYVSPFSFLYPFAPIPPVSEPRIRRVDFGISQVIHDALLEGNITRILQKLSGDPFLPELRNSGNQDYEWLPSARRFSDGTIYFSH